MTIMYSASAGGFFDTALHASIPKDAVRISAARYRALLAAQETGAIVSDKRGRPVVQPIPQLSLDAARQQALRAVKREAGQRIEARLPVWKQLNALRENRDPGFHQIDAIRAASDLIELQLQELGSVDAIAEFPVQSHPLWPSFDDREIDS